MENLEEILLDAEYQSRMGDAPDTGDVVQSRTTRSKGKRVAGARLRSSSSGKKETQVLQQLKETTFVDSTPQVEAPDEETLKRAQLAEQQAKEETQKLAAEKQQAEQQAKEETQKLAAEKQQAEQQAKEEAKKLAAEKQQAEQQAKEEAKKLAKEQAKEKAAQKAKAKADKKAKSKSKKWKHRKLTAKEKLILLIPIVATIVMIVVVWAYNRDISSYHLDMGGYQYYAGNSYRIDGNSTMRRTADEETVLAKTGSGYPLTSLPVYLSDTSFVLPQTMLYCAPRSGTQLGMTYFTEVEIGAGGNIIATNGNEDTILEKGFLYDGGDVYVFLETTIIEFNGYRIELPPMSYVEARPTGDVQAFNILSKECILEAPLTSVLATIGEKDYVVNLLGDSMVDYEGNSSLLYTRPELLDSVV